MCAISMYMYMYSMWELGYFTISHMHIVRTHTYCCHISWARAAYMYVKNYLFLFHTTSVPCTIHVHAVQVDSFLKQWYLPDCGQRTLPLMHKLKAQAGIVEPRRESGEREGGREGGEGPVRGR